MQLALEANHLGSKKSLATGFSDRRERPAPLLRMAGLRAEGGEYAETGGAAPHRATHAHEPLVHVGERGGAEALALRGMRDHDRGIHPVHEAVRFREILRTTVRVSG